MQHGLTGCVYSPEIHCSSRTLVGCFYPRVDWLAIEPFEDGRQLVVYHMVDSTYCHVGTMIISYKKIPNFENAATRSQRHLSVPLRLRGEEHITQGRRDRDSGSASSAEYGY